MSLIPSLALASTKQFSGRSGDVSGLGDSNFNAFAGPSPVTLLIVAAAAIVGLLIFKGRI